jgi:hypothetical protein
MEGCVAFKGFQAGGLGATIFTSATRLSGANAVKASPNTIVEREVVY